MHNIQNSNNVANDIADLLSSGKKVSPKFQPIVQENE